MDIEKQSLRWRVFALFFACFGMLIHLPAWSGLLARPTVPGVLSFVIAVSIVLGLLGYAFGKRFGPVSIYRVLSPILVVILAVRTGPVMTGLYTRTSNGSLTSFSDFTPLVAMLLMAWTVSLICLALLRYGEWTKQD